MSGRTVISTTARPGMSSLSSMPMARLAGSSAHIWRAVSRGSGIEVHSDALPDRIRLAGEHEAGLDLGWFERIVAAHLDLAVGDPGPAGAADAALASEREVGPHRLGAVEHGLVPRQRGCGAETVQ